MAGPAEGVAVIVWSGRTTDDETCRWSCCCCCSLSLLSSGTSEANIPPLAAAVGPKFCRELRRVLSLSSSSSCSAAAARSRRVWEANGAAEGAGTEAAFTAIVVSLFLLLPGDGTGEDDAGEEEEVGTAAAPPLPLFPGEAAAATAAASL